MPDNIRRSKIVSFSIPPTKPEDIKEVEKLQKYCKKSGMSFSHITVQGIKHMIEQMGLDNDN